MPRIPPSPVVQVRSATADELDIANKEHQWWMRIIFVGVSAASAAVMIDVLTTFVEHQDFHGAVLVSLFALIAAFFAVLAAPMKFQDRYMRKILIYGSILEVIINTLIILT